MAEEGKDKAKRVWVVTIRVSDFDRSVEFYRDVLGFPVQLDGRQFEWMEVGPDEPLCKIGFALDPERAGKKERTPTGIVLEVEDMDAFAARLRAANVEFVTEPTEMEWGGMLANFLDPDGNILQAVYDPRHYEPG